MGYCTVDDVASQFPSFQRNSAGDIQDAQIQNWIDQTAARIAAALVQRGFDPDAPPAPLTTRQSDLLAGLNEDAVAGKLGAILESRISMQTGEVAVAGRGDSSLKKIVSDIRSGAYDGFFGIASRLADPNAFAGADTDESTPAQRGENRAFGMNEDY